MAVPKLQLAISQPCGEDLRAIPLREGGRFCAACNKNVIDFTEKTDREILELFAVSGKVPCGLFRESQLNRHIVSTPAARVSGWQNYLLTFGALVASQVAFGQTATIKPNTSKTYASAKPVSPAGRLLQIKGTVKTRQGQALQETLVGIKGSRAVLAVTDSSGSFHFTLPESAIKNARHQRLVLTFYQQGYSVFEQPVSTLKNHFFPVTLDLAADGEPQVAVMEVTTYKPPVIGPDRPYERLIQGEILKLPVVYLQRPTWWQRIKNIFRSEAKINRL